MMNQEVFSKKAAKSEIAPFELNKEGRNSYALVLRYAGCDLMCPLCYAWRYAWFPKLEGYKLKEQDVLNALNDLYVLKLDRKIGWVRIQGGEPCLSFNRTLLTLRVCVEALNAIHINGLNKYEQTKAIIQTNGLLFSRLNDKTINVLLEKFKDILSHQIFGKIIFEVSFKDPTGKSIFNGINVLQKQIMGFKTLLEKIIMPLWNGGHEDIGIYMVAGLGPSIDFNDINIVPIDAYSLPDEYPLFHHHTWSEDFKKLFNYFINIVSEYPAYKNYRSNPRTNNGTKIPLEELEPNRFQTSWISGYAGKYKEYGIAVGKVVPPLSSILRRMNDHLGKRWLALCKGNPHWLAVLNQIPIARDPFNLRKLIREMNQYFYPSHPIGHYPYL